MQRNNYYRAIFRKDHADKPADWFRMSFEAQNYELASDHAIHCGNIAGIKFCTVERLPRDQGIEEVQRDGGKFLEI